MIDVDDRGDSSFNSIFLFNHIFNDMIVTIFWTIMKDRYLVVD